MQVLTQVLNSYPPFEGFISFSGCVLFLQLFLIVFLTPKFKAQNLIQAFKNTSVEEVEGSGHSLMMEEPNKVLEYLKKLFDN